MKAHDCKWIGRSGLVCLAGVLIVVTGHAWAQQPEPTEPRRPAQRRPGRIEGLPRISEDELLQMLSQRYSLTAQQRQELLPHLADIRSQADEYNAAHADEYAAMQEHWRELRKQLRDPSADQAKIREELAKQSEDWGRFREAGPLSSANLEQALLQVMPREQYEAKRQENIKEDVGRAMPWLGRIYDLSDGQRAQVRRMLEQRLRGDGRWWVQVQELRDAVEEMLPAEQVKRAHEQEQQWLAQRLERARGPRKDADKMPHPTKLGRRYGEPETPAIEAKPEAEAQGLAAPPKTEQPPRTVIAVGEMHPWQQYVQRFSEHYRLTEDQQGQAAAILEDCLRRSDDYTLSRSEEFMQLDAELESANDPQRRAELTAEKAALEQPLSDIFQELKNRLQNLLTNEQLKIGELPE